MNSDKIKLYENYTQWKLRNIIFLDEVKKYCFPDLSEYEIFYELLESGKQKLSDVITFEKYCQEKGI